MLITQEFPLTLQPKSNKLDNETVSNIHLFQFCRNDLPGSDDDFGRVRQHGNRPQLAI